MMGFIIKITITSGSGIKALDKFTEDNVKRVQKLAGNLPVIPIGGGLSFGSIKNDSGTGLINNIQKRGDSFINKMTDDRQKALNELLGIEDGSTLTATEKGELQNTITYSKSNSRQDFITKSKAFSQSGKAI
jgi:hypothetical protein